MTPLARACRALEESIRRQEERLQRELDRQHAYLEGTTPDDMLDMNGRPILLEARIALVNGLAALERAGA